MLIKADDFRCMWRGQVVRSLLPDETGLLAAFHEKKEHKKRALLMLHGFSSSPAVFRSMRPVLETLYDAIVCPLLPGHGTSIDDFQKAKAQDWLLCAEQSCERLIESYEQVDVLGLSLGGLLAYHLANRYPLHHAYLLAPALALQIPINLTYKLIQFLQQLGFTQIRNQAGNIHLKQHCEITYRRLPLASLSEILGLIQNTQCGKTHCQIDVFLGRYDEVVHSHKVAQMLNAHHIHWLEHSAHVLSLDGDVAQILAVMMANIESQGEKKA